LIKGGWVNQHWVQLGYQLADSCAGGFYSFVGTSIILFVLNLLPGLHLRASEEAEILGIDDAEIGEFAYDYVELTREVLNDMEGENSSMFSGDHAHFASPEKNSIPLRDARHFGDMPFAGHAHSQAHAQ